MNLNLLLEKIGISSQLTQDVSLLIFIALVSFIYGTFLGKHKLLTVLVNIYVSFSIMSVLPKKVFPESNMRILFFIVLILALTVLSRKVFDITFSGAGSSFLWKVFAMSFLQICLILSIIFSIMSKKESLGYISAKAYEYLVSGWAPLIWMAAPLIFMVFVLRKR